jgi:hypothetical protein
MVPLVLGIGLLLAIWVVGTLAVDYRASGFAPVVNGGRSQDGLSWSTWGPPLVWSAWGLAGLALLVRWRQLKKAGARPVLTPMLSGLVAAAVLAAGLSAAQLLPVAEFALQSVRAAPDGPHDLYAFSLFPIRVVEFLWPGVFGTPFRGNRFWLAALQPSGTSTSVWVPTLYLGALTLVLALGGWCRGPEVERAPWRAWMVVVAVVGLLGSFGEYGSPLFYARLASRAGTPGGPDDSTVAGQVAGAGAIAGASATTTGAIRDGDGGLYWLLATGLPGFGQFRYPGKLLTLTVLGLSSLAARGWDALASGNPRVRRRMAAFSGSLLVLTLVALATSVAGRGAFVNWLGSKSLPSGFGPLEVRAALAETQGGLVHVAIVLVISLALIVRLADQRPMIAAAMALAVTAVDLSRANARVVVTIAQSLLESTPEVVSIIRRAETERPRPGPYRVHRVPVWGLIAWTESSTSGRVGDFVDWARQTAEPKYGINFGVNYTRTIGAAELYDYAWYFGGFYYGAREKAARVLGVEPGTRIFALPRRAFDMWNTRYFILPYYAQWGDGSRGIASFVEQTERIHPPVDAFVGVDGRDRELDWVKHHDYQVRRNRNEYPRAWVVHDARSFPPIHGLSRAGRNQPMIEMLFSNDMSWPDPARPAYDPRRYAWLEDSLGRGLADFLPGGLPSTGEVVHVVRHEPDLVELDAVLELAGIVILADVYYPGWELTIDGLPAPIYRANRMMRGAAVAEGRHRLVYRYRPASFRIGLFASALGMGAVGLLAFRSTRMN